MLNLTLSLARKGMRHLTYLVSKVHQLRAHLMLLTGDAAPVDLEDLVVVVAKLAIVVRLTMKGMLTRMRMKIVVAVEEGVDVVDVATNIEHVT